MENSRLARGPSAGQSGRMGRWLRKIHQWVVGIEAWAAAYDWLSTNSPKIWEWIKDHWWSLLAIAGTLGFGTWFASGIRSVNELGWGAWPFVGAIFAVMVSLAFWLFSHGVWGRVAKRDVGARDVGENTYAISKITLFCNSALDPASDALLEVSEEIFMRIARNNQNLALFIEEQRDLMARLTTDHRNRLHALLQKQKDKKISLSQYEAARILRAYLEGYVLTLEKLTNIAGREEFVNQNSYAEWRFRHREFIRKRGEFSGERRLQAVATILGCIGHLDEKVYPEAL
jgi:hypothetical protein